MCNYYRTSQRAEEAAKHLADNQWGKAQAESERGRREIIVEGEAGVSTDEITLAEVGWAIFGDLKRKPRFGPARRSVRGGGEYT